MTHYQPWSPYTGSSSIILAVLLLIVAGVLTYFAMRLHHPVQAKQPGKFVGACVVVSWLLAVLAFLVAFTLYVRALLAQLGHITGPSNPITPVTVASGFVAFLVILYLTLPSMTSPIRANEFWLGVGSAVVGTIAAPLIFELPYDLIVIGKTHPPVPHALFALTFFLPLFIVEILSFAMVTFSPFASLSRVTLLLLAAMFLVFAVWAVFGFAYPSTPIPFACNTIGKIIAFAAAVSLFLPQKKPAKSAVS